MRYRLSATATLAGACIWLSGIGAAYADPVVLALQAYYESPQLFAPAMYLVLPDANGSLGLSQVGWTTRVDGEWRQRKHLALVGSAELTPFRAQSSNLFYDDDGREIDSADFRDTELAASWGLALRTNRVQSKLRFLVRKHWLDGLPAATSEMWRRPYAGPDFTLSYSALRSDDLYLARFQGLKAQLHAGALLGQTPFVQGEAWASYGERIGPFFALGGARAVYVSQGNLISRWLLGGSWDALAGQALFGHPFARYRVERAATAFVRLDWDATRSFSLGIRGAAAVMPGEAHHGEAAVLVLDWAGVVSSAGLAVPDLRLGRWTAFVSVMAATFP
jgi:hypothetical protein